MPKLEPVQLDIITKSDGKGADDAAKKIDGLGGSMKRIGEIASAIGLANIGSQIVGNIKQFMGEASQEATNFTKAMTTLDIIAGRFGESGTKAQEAAKTLGAELRIGVGPAAEGLQNLLKSGLDLDTAADLMKRFTNEAITGKSPTISLGQAVQNLTFAYATNNSALGNLSGISENFSDIIKKGEEALLKEGVAAGDITEEMAKLKGMMDLTNLTMGSAERFTGTLIDKQAQLDQKMTELKITVGTGLNMVLSEMIGFFLNTGVIDAFVEALKKIGAFVVEYQGPIMAFFIGALIPAFVMLGVTLWTSVIPALMTTIANLIILLAPFVAVGLAVTALYLAWDTNFLGIRDIVGNFVNWFTTYVWPSLKKVFDFLGAVLTTLGQIFTNVFNLIIKPLLGAFVTYFNVTFWQPIKAIFDLMTAALNKMGLSWSDVWNGIKAVVFGIMNAIVNEVKNKINFVINIINGLINGANAVGDKVPGYTKINTIPNLFNGTDYFKGGLARVGEQGPETVYLPRGSQVKPYDPVGGGGERPIEVTQIINSGADLDFAFRELAYVLRTS